MIITLVFEKSANFFAENWQKSQKIVIITSTPGHPDANQSTTGKDPDDSLEPIQPIVLIHSGFPNRPSMLKQQ
jgi:hypothetical protein